MANRSDITPELCRQLLRYEPETGKLFWLSRPREMFKSDRIFRSWNSRYADREAFTAGTNGYRVGRIFDLPFKAHRVAWAIIHGEWPQDGNDVDHINGSTLDNRICNLRSVSHQINNQNSKRPVNNQSGTVGVSWHKQARKWQAYIGDGKSRVKLGFFRDLQDAVAARLSAQSTHGYHTNHGRVGI